MVLLLLKLMGAWLLGSPFVGNEDFFFAPECGDIADLRYHLLNHS